MFHFGFEVPQPETRILDEASPELTSEEIRILKRQIWRNAALISQQVSRLDLLVNKERYPGKEAFIERIREQLFLLMDENDTFRKVLWQHVRRPDEKPGAKQSAA